MWKFDKNEPLNSLNLFHQCEGARRVWGGTNLVDGKACTKELDAMTVAYYKTLELYDE